MPSMDIVVSLILSVYYSIYDRDGIKLSLMNEFQSGAVKLEDPLSLGLNPCFLLMQLTMSKHAKQLSECLRIRVN